MTYLKFTSFLFRDQGIFACSDGVYLQCSLGSFLVVCIFHGASAHIIWGYLNLFCESKQEDTPRKEGWPEYLFANKSGCLTQEFFFFSNLFYILNEVQTVHLYDAFLTHVWTSLLISIAHTNSCLQLQPLRKGNLRNMLYVRLVSQGHNYIQIHNRGKYCVGLHICHFT